VVRNTLAGAPAQPFASTWTHPYLVAVIQCTYLDLFIYYVLINEQAI
jgi:hypothetical protein